MLKEYHTIREVVGPADDGGRRQTALNTMSWWRSSRPTARCAHGKVLEINGDKALVQLFESSAAG